MAYTPNVWTNDSGTHLAAAPLNGIEAELVALDTARGAVNGIATLDANGLVPVTQMPIDPTNVVTVGTRPPTSLDGIDGDGWIDTSTDLIVYPPKLSGSWAATGYPVATPYAGNEVAVGEESWPRWSSNGAVTITTGLMRLAFYTCRKAELKSNLIMPSSATAAVTTTYAAMGVYRLNADATLTLMGQCANDTTLFAAASTFYTRAITAPFTSVFGQRYALAVLILATTMPSIQGQSASVFDQTRLPLIGASLAGQSTLPSTVTAGSYVGSTSTFYGIVSP